MEELLKLNICLVDKTGQLRFLYDKISVNIRGLEALGVKSDQYGRLLIPIIMAKLPSEKWQEIRLKTFGKSTPCSRTEQVIRPPPQNLRYRQLEPFLVPLQKQSRLFQNVFTALKDISQRLATR